MSNDNEIRILPHRAVKGAPMRPRQFVYIVAALFCLAACQVQPATTGEVSIRYQNWKTICVGRYLVDVPTNVQLNYVYSINSGDTKLEKVPGTVEDAKRMANDKVRELQATPHKLKGTSYIKSIPLANNGILVQGWMVDFNTNNIDVFLYIPVTTRGKSFVYTYTTTIHTDDERTDLPKLITFAASFRPLEEGVIPKGEGLCLDDVILVNLPESFKEDVAVNWEDPYAKRLFLAFDTGTAVRKFLWLSQISGKADEECRLLGGSEKCDRLRFGKHPVGPIQGEELCIAGHTYDGRYRTYSFEWDNPGMPNSRTSPGLTATLYYQGVPLENPTAPTPFFSDAEALANWDRFVNSIRVRPVAVGGSHE